MDINPFDVVTKFKTLSDVITEIKSKEPDSPKDTSEEERVSISDSFKEGDLVVIAGPAMSGKTSFALNMASAKCKAKRIDYFSNELTREEVAIRIMSLLSDTPVKSIYDNIADTTIADFLLEKSNGANIKICDAAFSLNDIEREYRFADFVNDNSDKPDMIIIDCLQNLEASGEYENRQAELSRILRRLKAIAMRNRTVVVVTAQMRERTENQSDWKPVPLSNLIDCDSVLPSLADIIFVTEIKHRYDANGKREEGLNVFGPDPDSTLTPIKTRDRDTRPYPWSWDYKCCKFIPYEYQKKDYSFEWE